MPRCILSVSIFLVIGLVCLVEGLRKVPKTVVDDCGLGLPVVECERKDGKVIYIKAKLEPQYLRDHDGEVSHRARNVIKNSGRKGDNAGHLVANRLGGTGNNVNNLVPMNSYVNQHVVSILENEIYNKVVESDKPIKYQIWPQWDETKPNLRRPIAIKYRATVVGSNEPFIDVTIENPLYKDGPKGKDPKVPKPTFLPKPDDKKSPQPTPSIPEEDKEAGIKSCELPEPVKICRKKKNKVIYIEAEINKDHLRVTSEGYVSTKVREQIDKVKAEGDDAGHLIANRLGGTGSNIDNVVPMNLRLNRGLIAQLEDLVYQQVKSSNEPVIYEVSPQWDWKSDSQRPISIKYKATSGDDVLVDIEITNTLYTGPIERKPGDPKPTFVPPPGDDDKSKPSSKGGQQQTQPGGGQGDDTDPKSKAGHHATGAGKKREREEQEHSNPSGTAAKSGEYCHRRRVRRG